MKVSFSDLFTVTQEGISPKVPIQIGSMALTPGVTFVAGVLFGGISLANYIGNDVEITVDLENQSKGFTNLKLMKITRNPGSLASGGPFTPEDVQRVWEKGRTVAGEDPRIWRQDVCGARIIRAHHGDTKSMHGWEVDHVNPVAKGGSDILSNLQPLQWENNRAKSDGPLVCARTA